MSFQICMTYFLLQNTKEEDLEKHRVQTMLDHFEFHCMKKKKKMFSEKYD